MYGFKNIKNDNGKNNLKNDEEKTMNELKIHGRNKIRRKRDRDWLEIVILLDKKKCYYIIFPNNLIKKE